MQYNLTLQVVIELPHVFVQAVSYGVIVYAMIGFEWTGCQVLLVSIFHVFFTIVLHLLWHDSCWRDTKPPHCFRNYLCILYNMESLFRIHNPTTCEFLHLKFFQLQYQQISSVNMTNLFPYAFIFLHGIDNRGSPFGGDGTLGHVQ
jgi:hypothetical protein